MVNSNLGDDNGQALGLGPTTLRKAIRLANATDAADTVQFTAALTNQTILLGGVELAISKPLTIMGLGATKLTLDANNSSRIFKVDDNTVGNQIAVSISGLKLTRGRADDELPGLSTDDDDGGAIYNVENIALTGMAFELNSAVRDGGAIWIHSDGNGVLTDVAISRSTAVSGGGIYNRGFITLKNSNVSNNNASDSGGGIFNDSTLILTNSTLSANGASVKGGGVYNNSRMIMTNSTLAANYATPGVGGGIFTESELTITNSALTANSATSDGGGIYVQAGTATLTNVTLSSNSALSGGAIYNRVGTLTATNSTFTENSSRNLGGGIYNLSRGIITVASSTFARNTALIAGGGIASQNGDAVIVSNSTFVGNSGRFGGGMFAGSGLISVANSTFADNSASESGGALYVDGITTLANSTLSHNSALNGGGIFTSNGTLTVINSTIVGNAVTSDGGGIYHGSGEPATLFNTIVAGNARTSGTASDLAGNNVDSACRSNLIGDPSSAGGLVNGPNNIVGKDNGAGGRMLLPLADILDPTLRNNGGPTWTHALVAGSPAIDAWTNLSGVNLARLGAATQSSEYVTPFPAGNAIDGIVDATNFTHTAENDANATWTVTLPFDMPIGDVTLHNRVGNSGQRLRDIIITVLDANDQAIIASPLLNPENAMRFHPSSGNTSLSFDFAGAVGRKVRVRRIADPDLSGLFAVRNNPADPNVLSLSEVVIKPANDQRGPGFARVVGAAPDIGAFEMPRPLFTDNFERLSNASLGSPWVKQAGALGIVNSNRAEGTSAAALHMATIAGFSATDVELEAFVALSNQNHSGLLARYAGAGDKNYYYASLTIAANGSATARIVKNVNGVVSELAVVEDLPIATQSGILRFRVVGSSLQLFFNDILRATTVDSTFKSGSIGLRLAASHFAFNFQAWPVSTGAAIFDAFTAQQVLAEPWTNASGFFRVVNSKVQGTQALNLAVVNGASEPNVELRAVVNAPGINNSAGLVARYQGAGDKNYYLGRITRTSIGFVAQVLKNVNGVVTVLATKTVLSSTGKASLRFVVTGSNLRLFVNNVPVADVLDNSLATGSVGFRGDSFVTFDDFYASPVAADTTFRDRFFLSADGVRLSDFWTRRAGEFMTTDDKALGKAPAPAVNLASVVAAKSSSVFVQATISLTTKNHEIGLLANYSGPGDANYYMARVLKTAAGFQISIVKNVAGVVTTLASRQLATITGPVTFAATTSLIGININGILELSATDRSLPAGNAGIRSIGMGAIDDFLAANVTTSDLFETFQPAVLGSHWLTRLGRYTTASPNIEGQAKGTAALNLATLPSGPWTNADVQALVFVPAVIGQSASLVARYSGAGDLNMYLASVSWNGTVFMASISKKINGTTTLLASVNLGAAHHDNLRFTVIGGELKLYFGGIERLSVWDFSLKSGLIGIRSTLHSTFDNLQLRDA